MYCSIRKISEERLVFLTNVNVFDAPGETGTGSASVTTEVVVIPEPATMSILAIGGLGALLRKRR